MKLFIMYFLQFHVYLAQISSLARSKFFS